MKTPVPETDVLTPSGDRAPLALKLQVISGPDFGAELQLQSGTYSIGKDPGASLVLSDNAVSRMHLMVEVLADRLRVSDPGSTNGAFFEGNRFTHVEVGAGASVHIGRTVLKVVPAETPRVALPPSEHSKFGGLVGQTVAMRSLFAVLGRLSQSDTDVLVYGETGTGKEVCAEALHREGIRAAGPFVVCDLASVSPTLFESELFGHVKGAFTGASSDRVGAFERAHGGTLFLDEVGEVSSEIQPRLLRALERRQVKRVGGDAYRTFDVRVVAATHRHLEAEVKAGRFRKDLYHRLAVVTLTLPPLRERLEDLPLLVDILLERMGRKPSELSKGTRALLRGYHWPGNLRELRNVLERAVHFGSATPELPTATLTSAGAMPFKEAKEQLVQAFERDYLAELIRSCGGNLSRAAREAQLDRVHLRKLLRKHNLIDRDGDD